MTVWVLLLLACGGAAPEVPPAPVPEPHVPARVTPDALRPLELKAPPPGACEYEPFDVPCALAEVRTAKVTTKSVTVQGAYVAQGHGEPILWSLVGPAGREEEMKAHLRANAQTTCHGRRLVKGACGPGRWTVEVPPLAPSAGGDRPAQAP